MTMELTAHQRCDEFAAAGHGESLAGRIFAILARFAWWWRLRRDREHLYAMPDHMLRDIGINRADIDYVTMFGRERRTRQSEENVVIVARGH